MDCVSMGYVNELTLQLLLMSGLNYAAGIVELAVEPTAFLAVVEGVFILARAALGELVNLTVVHVGHDIATAFGQILTINTIVFVGIPRATVVGLVINGDGLVVGPLVEVDLLGGNILSPLFTFLVHLGSARFLDPTLDHVVG